MSALGQKRTCAAHKPVSAKCQKQTSGLCESGAAKACANLPRNHYLEFTNESGLRAVISKLHPRSVAPYLSGRECRVPPSDLSPRLRLSCVWCQPGRSRLSSTSNNERPGLYMKH